MRFHILVLLLLFAFQPGYAEEVTLTRLHGGTIWQAELDRFSDTRAYVGQTKRLTASSYLITHGDQYLIWDTGLPLSRLGKKLDPSRGKSHGVLEQTLESQLAELGIEPSQIDFVGISHYHWDHVGQTNSFPQATLLVGAQDWERLSKGEKSKGFDPSLVSHWIGGGGQLKTVSGDFDVFGDGRVVMLATPGHTHGHHSLLVMLKEMGPVLLSGDLAHFQENYANDRVPSFNLDRADTLASLDRFKRLQRNLRATVIIAHEPAHIERLPKFPKAAK